jgi:hypothetical protein
MRGWLRRWGLLAAALAVPLLPLVGTWSRLHPRALPAQVALLSAALPVVAAVVQQVVDEIRRRRADQSGQGEELAREAWRLAGAVREREDATLARLVGDTGNARTAEVGFSQPGMVFWRTDGGAPRGSLSRIEGYYRGLRRGRLVVLGPAGSGKTVLGIRLVRDLAAALVDTRTPARVVVPVRFSASAFDPAAGQGDLAEVVSGEQLSERLDGWLAEQLVTGYGVPEKPAAALVAGGWVLPFLDGVDEMDRPQDPPSRAAALVAALNQATERGARPVVMTCRTTRYRELTIAHPTYGGDRDVLQDATVVEVQPLDAEAVRKYLRDRFSDPAGSGRGEPRWRPVLDRLSEDRVGDPVVTALRSPLRLFLAVTAYRAPSSDPVELIRRAAVSTLDDALFAGLVPAITESQPRRGGGRYSAGQVTRWLTTLARYLHAEELAGRSGTDLRLDELWSAAGTRAPRYTAAAMLTALAPVALLLLGLSAFAAAAFPNAWAVVGVVSFVTMVGVAWKSSRRTTKLLRLDPRTLRTAKVQRRLAVGLGAGLTVGLLLWAVGGLRYGLVVGLVYALVLGLGLGFRAGLETRPEAIDRPRRLVSQGIAHTGARFALGLGSGLFFGLLYGLLFDLTAGLVVGLTFGVAFGLLSAQESPWPRYLVACLLLARRGNAPLRLAVFLDWAYAAGLMQLAGTSLQFRHREFQHWLIRHDRAAGAAEPSLPGAAPAES